MIQIKQQATEKDIILRAFHNLAMRDEVSAATLVVELNLRCACCDSGMNYDLGLTLLDKMHELNIMHYKEFYSALEAGGALD